jgi:hypothetical protein
MNTMVNGLRMFRTVTEKKNFRMVPITKETLLKALRKGMGIMFVNLECMKDSSKGEILMEKALLPTQIIVYIREDGPMVCCQDLVYFPGLMGIGTKENTKQG